MSDDKREDTALGVARQRFVVELSRRSAELRSAVNVLSATPDGALPRDELRKRLHALYASAQVFRIEALANGLKDGIQRLDTARDTGTRVTTDDLQMLEQLATALPRLGGVEGDEPSPSQKAPPRVPSRSGRESVQFRAPPRELPRAGATLGRKRRASGSFEDDVVPLDENMATVTSVLVLDEVEAQTLVRSALPSERFEVLATDDPEEALRLARSTAPDVVVADRSILLRPSVDFIGRLRSDPLTDFVPVIMLLPPGTPDDRVAVRDAGADDALHKPLDADALRKTIERIAGVHGGSPMETLGDVTVEEVAERLAAEIRRGLVERTATGKQLKVPMGDGADVMSAAWAAVAQVRSHMARRSGGRVRFRDPPGRGPSLLGLSGATPHDDPSAAEVSLRGRQVLVADDDPAVVWFFASLLRESGAEVIEAADGKDALAQARARRPDLVITDILMPRLDGFGLCREIRRDPALSEVPIIVLSWKEDFLQRMRDLKAGASGYLRKEAGSAQILAQVRAALRPRARLEAELQAGGEVRGRIEGIGMPQLLRDVSQHRGRARVTVRDAWNLFEAEVRDGTLADVTRTATDGSFARGTAVVPSLLAVATGRFTVADSDATLRPTIEGSLAESLDRGLATLRAQLASVSGKHLSSIERVTFQDDVLSSYLRTSPDPIRELVGKLVRGSSPRDLLLRGEVEARTLESGLLDLVRRGAVARVDPPIGTPEEIEEEPTPRPVTTPPRPQPAAAPPAEEEIEIRLSSPGVMVDEPSVIIDGLPISEERTVPDAGPLSAAGDAPIPLVTQREGKPIGKVVLGKPRREQRLDDFEILAGSGHDDPRRDQEEIALSARDLEAQQAAPRKKKSTKSAIKVRPGRDAVPGKVEPAPAPPPSPPEASGPPPAAWALLAIVFLAVGFIGYRLIEASSAHEPASEPAPPVGDVAPSEPAPEPRAEVAEDAPSEAPPQEASSPEYGERTAGVPEGMEVAEGQGVLRVESLSGLPWAVRTGDRDLGSAPVQAALPPGRYRLLLVHEQRSLVRFVFVEANTTFTSRVD